MADPSPAAVEDAVSFAVTSGIVMAVGDAHPAHLVHAPFTLHPSPVPRPAFEEAYALALPFSDLVGRLAEDANFLNETLAEVAKADSHFTGRLLGICNQVRSEAPGSQVGDMSILRCDYFVDQAHQLKQVEINTIAASFGCLGTRTAEMHRFLQGGSGDDDLPPNDVAGGLARGMVAAHKQFVAARRLQSNACKVVFVVQGGERNRFDQDILRMEMTKKHGVAAVRMTLSQIDEYGSLAEQQDSTTLKDLKVSGLPGQQDFVASVVYFRAGYGPDDYPSDKEWNARYLIERATAFKCPSIATQLVGAKKIQQVLDLPGVVEKYSATDEDAARMRRCFAKQYALGSDAEGTKAAALGVEASDDFVLKPQREGGGNNLYSDDLKKALQEMPAEDLAGYVLMERIRPLEVHNTILRNCAARSGEVVSELGVFTVMVKGREADRSAFVAGHLLRSKFASVDDGGVAAGVAVLDSPRLFDGTKL